MTTSQAVKKTNHRGAKLGVPGIRFVSGDCHCDNCKGWLWSRHLIAGTRIEPYWVYGMVVKGGDSVEAVADDYGLTVEQVEAAIEWGRRYGGLKNAV